MAELQPPAQLLPELSRSAWGRPDEETLLADVEVDVLSSLVRHEATEVSADYAVPDRLVPLLEGGLHVRSNKLRATSF